jgi:hypothetical protein
VSTDLHEAVQGLYDAVVVPERWARASHGFGRATNSVGCLFYPRNQAQALIHLPVPPEIQEFVDAYVNDGWYRQDINAIRGWPQAAIGKLVITDDEIATREKLGLPQRPVRGGCYHYPTERGWPLLNGRRTVVIEYQSELIAALMRLSLLAGGWGRGLPQARSSNASRLFCRLQEKLANGEIGPRIN